MKKLARLSIILLAAAVVLTIIGGKMVWDADINVADIYDIIEDNITIVENNVSFERAEKFDMSNIDEATSYTAVTYQLNEFNTLKMFVEGCTAKMSPTDGTDITLALSGKASMQTCVKDGCLYVNCTSEQDGEAVVSVGIPENYKGGFVINGSFADIRLSDIDSSMDVSFNLYDSTLTAQTISGREILLEMSGGSCNIDEVSSTGGFTVTNISSDMTISQTVAAYTIVTANSAEISLNNIVGSLTSDFSMCSATLSYLSVTGNVAVTARYSSVDIKIPSGAAVSLRREVSWSRFSDSVNWNGGDGKNENNRYVIDINVEFGIVSLSEKE